LKAAACVEFPAPAPGGGPVCVPEPNPPPLPAFAGGVTPCALRQATRVDRPELAVVEVEADLDTVVEVVAELPQAAIAPLEMTTASASEARRRLNMVWFMKMSFRAMVKRSWTTLDDAAESGPRTGLRHP
jgi:hypothetical protein